MNGPRLMKITDTVAAAPQLYPDDLAAVAEAGFQVLVNNRPDGEAPDQPSSEAMRAAAEAVGLEYHYYPVDAFNYPGSDLAHLAALFDDEQRPVLAYCRSGTRSTNLWVSSRSEAHRDDARQHAHRMGFDVSMSLR